MQERLDLARRAAARAEECPYWRRATCGKTPRSTRRSWRAWRKKEYPASCSSRREIGARTKAGWSIIPPAGGAVPAAVFLYECPLASPRHVASDVSGRLARQHGIVGIKHTTCTPEGIRAKIESATVSLVFQANMSYLRESVLAGARHYDYDRIGRRRCGSRLLAGGDERGCRSSGSRPRAARIFGRRAGQRLSGHGQAFGRHAGRPDGDVSRKCKGMNASAAQGMAVWWRSAQRALGLTC